MTLDGRRTYLCEAGLLRLIGIRESQHGRLVGFANWKRRQYVYCSVESWHIRDDQTQYTFCPDRDMHLLFHLLAAQRGEVCLPH